MLIDPQSADYLDVSPPYCRLKNLVSFKIIAHFENGDFYMSGVKSKILVEAEYLSTGEKICINRGF